MSKQSRGKWARIRAARNVEANITDTCLYDKLIRNEISQETRDVISDAIVIKADNVALYLEKYGVVDTKTLPSIMPPFVTTFIECNYVQRYGFCVVCDPMPSGNWLLFILVFSDRPNSPVLQYLNHFEITIDSMGRIVREGVVWVRKYEKERASSAFEALSLLPIMTLALLNCSNVVLTDNDPSLEQSKVYEQHFGAPMSRYKTLAIKPMSRHYNSGKPQQRFDVIPLHLRRGNFAHYNEDAPLFGKYTGTFWRPATVVGSEKNGIVAKDYEVK